MLRTVRLLLLPALLLLAAAAPLANEPATHNQQLFVLKSLKPDAKSVGLMVSADFARDEAAMTSVRRAATGAGVKIFLGTVETVRDVATKFRDLKGENVDAIWVIEAEGVMGDRATRSFLIDNTTRQRVPLMAPSATWVAEGAAAAVEKGGAGLSVAVNAKVLAALSINVPDALKASATVVSK